MRRHELSDKDWEQVKDLFPANGGRGGQWKDHREMLSAMMWILRTGAPWRDLPERYGPWQSVYDRFRRWRQNGTLDKVVERLQMRLDAEGKIDWDLWAIDGTNIRASRAAAGGGKKGVLRSLPITHWGAREVVGVRRYIWSPTEEPLPSPPSSAPDKHTNRPSSKRR